MRFLGLEMRRGRVPSPQRAAVQPLSVLGSRAYRRFRQREQERAVFFARKLGLIRFANALMADSASRVLIRPEYQTKAGDPRSWEPAEGELHNEILHRYRNETEEMTDLVRLRVWHDGVTGECLQCVDLDDRGRPMFRIRSAQLADYTNRGILIRDIAGGGVGDGTAKWYPPNMVRRLWTPDEEQPLLATSPTMGVLEDIERYWALHRATKRRAESALGVNGIIWVPTGAQQNLPRPQQIPGGPSQPGTKFERDYYEVTKRGLEDDDDVSAYAPLLWSWHKDFGAPEYIPFNNNLDQNAIPFRREAVEDIARGLNYPQRLLVTGVGEGNHWSDWLLQPEFARSTVAPVLERVLWRDLTASYYRPALRGLQARGLFPDDPNRYRIGFDLSPIVVHPDASARAIELHKLALLGFDTVLEANGFDVGDLPSREEFDRWVEIQEVLSSRASLSIGPTGGESAPARPPQPAAIGAGVGPFPGELVGWLD